MDVYGDTPAWAGEIKGGELTLALLFSPSPGFAVTAQVDEHQHLSRIFVSDVLRDSLAYGGGLCAAVCVRSEFLTVRCLCLMGLFCCFVR